jgi:hypothetical protein
MPNLDKYAKAFVALLVAGLGSMQVALSDGHVTATEVVVALLAGLAALGLTWAVPNEPAAPAAVELKETNDATK